ncbi:MAG: helix-turn-helix domain-containing protein [Bacteroidales bacterium]|nr:helix-turn-helix domain-containing protein [Bacteroidales bacterium]
MNEELKSILEKIRGLSNQYAIRSLSMDEICLKIGVSKQCLYKHVKGKTDLVEVVLQNERDSFEEIFTEFSFVNTNAIDILFIVSREVSRRFLMVNPSVTFDLAKYYPEIYQKHLLLRSEFIFDKMNINIRKGIQQGMYRPDLSQELVARLYIRRLMDIHNPEYFPPEKYSFSMLFEVMLESFVRSIATPEGIAYFEEKKRNADFAL